jgi:hypothetical protein
MALPALLLAQTLLSLPPRLTTFPTYDTPLPAMTAEAPVLESGDALAPGLFLVPVTADTVRRRRAVRLSYSYYRRLDLHRWVGYAVPPLFLAEFLAGDKLLKEGSAAPLWAEKSHKPIAYALAGVFTFNAVTGVWNLAEAGKVQSGKTRRWVHSIMMLASSAGFIYSAQIAPSTADIDARIAAGKRGGWTPHKRAAVASIGLATVAHAMMFIWKD